VTFSKEKGEVMRGALAPTGSLRLRYVRRWRPPHVGATL